MCEDFKVENIPHYDSITPDIGVDYSVDWSLYDWGT